MGHNNVEVKARVSHQQWIDISKFLHDHTKLVGRDSQTDTYFKVPLGRLKVRQGNIECALVQYIRPNVAEAKVSACKVVHLSAEDGEQVRQALALSCGIFVVVTKTRWIYKLGNIKFHLDDVLGLGRFTEIEVSDEGKDVPNAVLQSECDKYITYFGLKKEDFISESYSDMISKKAKE